MCYSPPLVRHSRHDFEIEHAHADTILCGLQGLRGARNVHHVANCAAIDVVDGQTTRAAGPRDWMIVAVVAEPRAHGRM
jgi:hypothetical protein